MQTINYSDLLADRTKNMEKSAIRELLKMAGVPGMISLAGGLPATELFSLEVMERLNNLVLKKYGKKVFQYSVTEGLVELREALANYLKTKSISVAPSGIHVAGGAMPGLDAIAKVLINKGDKVAVESPTFLATIKSFKAYEANLVGIPTDENGIIPSEFEKLIAGGDIKFSYLITTFQNPTGISLSAERRQQVAQIIKKYNHLIVEDDPYYELRYSGSYPTPLYTLAPENVVYMGTMSKIFSPGLRIGYYLGPELLVDLMTNSRQAVDVHASTYAQALAAEYITSGELDKMLPILQSTYKKRLETMLAALDQHMPKGFTWTRPEGGMFVWISGDKNFDATAAYPKAIQNQVAYVPGQYFFIDQEANKNHFRLNFTNVSEDDIVEGVKRLAAALIASH